MSLVYRLTLEQSFNNLSSADSSDRIIRFADTPSRTVKTGSQTLPDALGRLSGQVNGSEASQSVYGVSWVT